MSRLDALPADQRAVLKLLLAQDKSYGDIAGLLRMSDDAVRTRAHQALRGLADPDDASLEPVRCGEVGDYLLGQQTASQRAGTRAFLEDSAPARAWARALVAELRPLGGDALPDVPADPAEVDEAFDALGARRAAQEDHRRSSRLGGILLLVGLGIAVAVVLVIVLTGGGGDGGDKSPVADTTAAATQPNTTTTPVAQINLVPPDGGSKPIGVAAITANNGAYVMALAATGLPPTSGFSYAVWLYTSQTKAKRLGFAPVVGTNGKLTPVSTPLPANASTFKKVVITRETARRPTMPGKIVLQGPLSQ